MLCRLVWYTDTDFAERSASVLRVKQSSSLGLLDRRMLVTIYHSIRRNTAVTASQLENMNLTTGQWNSLQRVESADGSVSLEP